VDVSIEPTLHCPCDGAFREPTFHYTAPPEGETKFPLGDNNYRRSYERCMVCEHWFGRHDIPLAGLYDDAYVDATYGGVDGMVARLERVLALPPERSDNAARVRRIVDFSARADAARPPLEGPVRTVLDVGAGIGVFPVAMLAAGWSVVAVEPDARTVRMLTEHLGIRAEAADLFDLTPERLGKFDAVTFNKVLEHVEDPVALLAHAGAFLRRGGFCYVEVPDVLAASAGPDREEFFIEHHHVFSPASLALLSERAGLEVVQVERLIEPSGKFTVYAFMTQRPVAT
jgi:SAM-dependent methyltransferase